MTAYPQSTVFHIYLLGGYSLYLIARKAQVSRSDAVSFLFFIATALAVAAVLAFPVYRDLIVIFLNSERIAPDPSFFTIILPKFSSFIEAVRFFALVTVPEILGNPIEPLSPFFPYAGFSFTLVIVFFSAVAMFSAFKKTWGWWLAIAVFCLFTFVQPFYVFAVKYLGFGFSRSTPFGGIMLPFMVVTAFGVDALMKPIDHEKLVRVTVFSGVCVLAIIAVGVVYALSQDIPVRWSIVAGMLLLSGMLIAQCQKIRPLFLYFSLVIVLAISSYPLMLRQDRAEIATTSPLVEKIRDNLLAGERFSVANPGVSVLPPNLNAALGLASLHSYNSLSSKRYHTLIRSLGGEVQTYGRWNSSIAPDYSSAMFWMSNIGLVLSPSELSDENLASLGKEASIYLYRVISRMGECLQVIPSQIDLETSHLSIPDPRLLPKHAPTKLVDHGDMLQFEVFSDRASVLILSQKFHEDWQASVFGGEGWQPARTIDVNGVFQGVLLPPETQRVRLDFTPFARYAYIAHVFWFFLLALVCCKAWKKKRNIAVQEKL